MDGMVNTMQDNPAAHCVLRIFNGPLQGCEFALAQRRTLFVVGGESEFCSQDRPLSVPEDAIYIPLESGGCNFEVLLDDNGRTGCRVRLLRAEGAEERLITFQELENLDGLQIALRLADVAWLETLLLPPASGPVASEPIKVPGTVSQRVAAGIGATALLVALILVGWQFSRPGPVSNVEALIMGAHTSMTVLYGRDREVYVFADSEREASWGRQVLVRNGYVATQVLTRYDEQARLEKLLLDLMPGLAYHRLDLSNPALPRLLLSVQRNTLTVEARSRLQQALYIAAPYATEVQLLNRDDKSIAGLAEENLKRLALPFTRQEHADSVTFTVEGSLEDGELQALNALVSDFNQQWGDRYVHFAIELKDDWLKGKSFQYGPQGYIKMTPSSWYFPKPI